MSVSRGAATGLKTTVHYARPENTGDAGSVQVQEDATENRELLAAQIGDHINAANSADKEVVAWFGSKPVAEIAVNNAQGTGDFNNESNLVLNWGYSQVNDTTNQLGMAGGAATTMWHFPEPFDWAAGVTLTTEFWSGQDVGSYSDMRAIYYYAER